MIVFIALLVLAFNCSTASILLAGKAFASEPSMVDIFDPFDADHAVLLLEVALRNPNSADVVNPNVVTYRNV